MEMINSFVPITGRVKFPVGVTVKEGVEIRFAWKEVVCKHDPNHTVIELYFQLLRLVRPGFLELETDTVLNWDALPNLTRDRKKWEKVRKLSDDYLRPNDAYAKVAFDTFLERWKFAVVKGDDDKRIDLVVHRNGAAVSDIVAQATYEAIKHFFDFDWEKIEAEAREKLDAELA